MTTPPRKKQPEQVRAAILAQAAQIAADHGVPALTLQAVAQAAGVTKGGLLHHFPSRDAVIEALITQTFEAYEASLEAAMAEDTASYGCFTRAYIRTALPPEGGDAPSIRLMAALWTDPRLRNDWYRRMSEREARHHDTDPDPYLKLLRFAADGIWIAATEGEDPTPWLNELLAKTHSPPKA